MRKLRAADDDMHWHSNLAIRTLLFLALSRLLHIGF
jgi:hypothetical protein